MLVTRRVLAVAAALSCSPFSFAAAPTSGPNTPQALDALVVVASKTEESAAEVAATVSVIDSDEIDRRNVHDIRDLVRYEPGVSVSNEASRFGLGGFTIRGLGGNRVAIQVDGVPVADAFAIGSFSSAGRDAVDVDLLKQVEILRGPASSLYGSDALAGVVGFVTKDASDFLAPDDPFAGRIKIASHAVDESHAYSALAAASDGRWSTLALIGERKGGARDNQGEIDAPDASRTRPNPQDYRDRSLLAKLRLDPAPGQHWTLTADALRSHAETQVLSARATQSTGPSRVRVDSLRGDDRLDRDRVSLAYEADLDTLWSEQLRALVFAQNSDTTQDTFEQRTNIAASGAETRFERERRFGFAQDVQGLEATLVRRLDWGPEHRLVYGGQWQRSEVDQIRDGLQRNLATGSVSPVILPDVFPVRDFPRSRTTEAAFYLEDRMRWLDGRFELQPGLRWDRIELDPQLDAIFAADNPGIVPQAVEHHELSPKLAAAWHLSPAWSVHALWAEGFRAPPYSDVNVGFTNLQFGYTAIPNPDLEPETSRGTELGLRLRGEPGYIALSVFRTDYDDFIESLINVGRNAQGLLVFQSQNLAEVRIEGAELRAALALDAWHPALQGWRLNASLAHASGDDLSHDQPLDSVDPDRAVLGVGYTSADGRWDLELVASGARRKSRVAVAEVQPFLPSGYVLGDALVQWRPNEQVALNLGIYNLFDRRVWEWGDVRGRAASDPVIDRYSSPGRNLSASLVLNF